MPTTNNVKHALLLSRETQSRYSKFSLAQPEIVGRFVYFNEDDRVRTPSSGASRSPFAELEIHCYIDPGMSVSGTYGWSCRYTEASFVDLHAAETMVKALRKIDRYMGKMDGEIGYPQSFGEYMVRVCAALGVKIFGISETNNNGGHDENRYRWGGQEYGQGIVKGFTELDQVKA